MSGIFPGIRKHQRWWNRERHLKKTPPGKRSLFPNNIRVLSWPTIPGSKSTALEGAPGVFSARYAGKNATDRQNVEKLLGKLESGTEKNRSKRLLSAAPWPLPKEAGS